MSFKDRGFKLERAQSKATQSSCRRQLLTALDPASRALLISQSGPHASLAFTTIPFGPEFTYPSHIFRILLLRRLRLPLPLAARTCRCRRTLDFIGDHRAACARSGVLRNRGGALERAAARVCREAGARVTTHTLLSELNVPTVDRMDNRRIEVIANGLPLHNGAQLAVDTTLASPLTSTARPRQRRGDYTVAALAEARRAKERTYPELQRGGRCKLIVVALEVGGRWSGEAADFVRLLAQARSRSAPALLRPATTQALIARWSALLTHAAQTAFARSLLFEDPGPHTALDGEPLPLSDILDLTTTPAEVSRLPP
eukprot:Skav228963  [mRNA]  locus=scaffold671:28044:28988:+ [translate_table: standard]